MLSLAFSMGLFAVVFAQTNRFPPINLYDGDPTGVSCAIEDSIVQSRSTGIIYSCIGGFWISGSGLDIPVFIDKGGTSATNLSGAQANLGINGETFNVMNTAYAGGAKGDKSTDDTAAIQAAFDACWKYGGASWGGIVQFPGNHTYLISSTIHAHDGCRIEGTIAGLGGGFTPPQIAWNGSATGWGTTLTITHVDVEKNCTTTAGTCIYSPSFPQVIGSNQYTLAPNYATITAANSLAVGQWVEINGLTSLIGAQLNRCIGEVASATRSSFVLSVPCFISVGASGAQYGSTDDSGTATTESVVVAFDANARYDQEVSNIQILPNTYTFGTANTVNPFNVGFYYGSRIDTGSNNYHTIVSGSNEYGYYYALGGINAEFGEGWRSDGARVAAVYWRMGGGDIFSLGRGTVDNNMCQWCTTTYSGGVLMLDNVGREGFAIVHVKDVKFESNTSQWPDGSGTLPGGAPVPKGGVGAITLLDNPYMYNYNQLFLDLDNFWTSPGSSSLAGLNYTSIVVSPVDDQAINVSFENSGLPSGTGSNTTVPFVGIPALSNDNMIGTGGFISHGGYAFSANSAGSPIGYKSPFQYIGDVEISQLWQHKVFSSAFLESDAAFTALPSGTTLYAGQIIAPPTSWMAGNYYLQPVTTTGTTGTLNGGSTTGTTPVFTITGVSVSPVNVCNFTGTWNTTAPYLNNQIWVTDTVLGFTNVVLVANQGATSTTFSSSCTHSTLSQQSDTGTAKQLTSLRVSSAAGLSVGQMLSIGGSTYQQLQVIDTTDPLNVSLRLTTNTNTNYSAQALSYAPPVLGVQGQIPPTVTNYFNLAYAVDDSSGSNSQAVTITTGNSQPANSLDCVLQLSNNTNQKEISTWYLSGDTNSVGSTQVSEISSGVVGYQPQYVYLTAATTSQGSSTNTATFSIVNSNATSGFTAQGQLYGVCYNYVQPFIAPVTISAKTPSVAASAPFIYTPQYKDSTGTGGMVQKTSPTLVTPALGTPSSGVITNLTGTCASCSVGSAATATTATTATTAANLSGTPALPNGTTATTQSAGDNSGKLATTASLQLQTGAPLWLQNLGSGADGSYEYSSTGSCSTSPTHCVTSCTSGSPCSIYALGEVYTTAFMVDSGAYVYSDASKSGGGLVIHSTGACTIAGTMLLNGVYSAWPNSNKGLGGGSSGGSGGGAAVGTTGIPGYVSISTGPTFGSLTGGTAGTSSGGNGANGPSLSANYQRAFTNAGAGGLDGLFLTGATGVQGGSTGGAGGEPGGGVVMMCALVNGSGGMIDLSGAYGAPPAANSTGAGSGGGGGVAILSSQQTVSSWPTIYVAGGPGGLVTVPEALSTSGSCTTQSKVTLGVTTGALSSCTVVQAGAGCGSGTNVKFNILGGGGTGGTITPTWSGGALASCTASGGSGYTAATYTTAGTGGDGGNGWYSEFQGW